jgi:hypothetical protein
VSAIVLLMVLLALSAVGSFLVGGRGRGVGLASGIEFVALGFVVGPDALAMVDRAMIDQFEPIVQAALSWFSFIVALDIGFVGTHRAPLRVMIFGAVSALLTGGLVFGAVLAVVQRFHIADGRAAILLAGGVGCACAETTRHVVRWAEARHGAKGKLTEMISGFGSSDDVAPILAAAVFFAMSANVGATVHVPIPFWGFIAATVGLGVVLGGVAMLLVRQTEGYEVWAALIGTLLLGSGIAARFGLLPIAVTFVMGIVLGFSKHRRSLRQIVRPTERGVILPALLLAGTRLDFHGVAERKILLTVVAAAIVARLFGKIISGGLVRGLSEHARKAGGGLGLALMSSGALSIAVGLSFALRMPGTIGDTVLVAAVACAVAGEILGPRSLRVALTRAGDIEPPVVEVPRTPTPVPAAPESTEELPL